MFSYPFEKHTPSIVVVGTPFQALCAVEAIRDLEINDYIFYAVSNRNARDNQMFAVLDSYRVDYQIVDKYKDIYPYSKRLLTLKSMDCKYHRAFVGSFASTHLYYWAVRHISDKSIVISLDDGNNTITILHNKKVTSPRNFLSFLNEILLRIVKRKRRIVLRKHLYTIYSDIINKKFKIRPNNLSHLFLNQNPTESHGVFFVGTNPASYRKQMSIDKSNYLSILELSFKKLLRTYPDEKCTYIPHGMDIEEETKKLCLEYNFDYIRPTVIIELYMCNLTYTPKIIIGFTSTALLNLKKIYPSSTIYNILLERDGQYLEPYKTYSNYYSQNGIIQITERI